MTKSNFFTFLLLCGLLGSCAKGIEEKKGGDSDARTIRNQTIPDPDIQKFFKAQSASCRRFCDPAVAKLIVYERGKIEYCTATLVDKDILVTSSNCLARNMRLPGISCVNSVFAVFPQTHGNPEVKVGCERIISSANLPERGDPALWRSDYAFIKLSEPVERRPVAISREGLGEGEKLTTWKMTYQSDRGAILDRDECFPVLNSYTNPFARNALSPMVPVAECSLNEGNVGAPLFNRRGELVGLISAKMDKGISSHVISNNLVSEKIAPIQHASNFACVKVPLEKERGFEPGEECSKRIDIGLLDRHRSRLLRSKMIHEENMRQIRDILERPDRIFKWNVKFYSNRKGNVFESHIESPRCFFDIESWIGSYSRRSWRSITVYENGEEEFRQPKYVVKTFLNRLLRPISVIEKQDMKTFTVKFNPADAYFSKSTEVTVTGELFGSEITRSYEAVTDLCSEKSGGFFGN